MRFRRGRRRFGARRRMVRRGRGRRGLRRPLLRVGYRM